MAAAPLTNHNRLERLEEIVADQAKRIAQLEAVIAALRGVFTGGGTADAATDRELDSQYGDPPVQFIPRDWTVGDVSKGQKFSCCPADFLDLLAETYDYFATKNDAAGKKDTKGRPKSFYDKKNARFARGWARRIRSGWRAPAEVEPRWGSAGFGGGGDGGPFGGGPSRFGGGGSPQPAAPESGSQAVNASGSDEAEIDTGTSFPFGANAAASGAVDDDDEEEPPL